MSAIDAGVDTRALPKDTPPPTNLGVLRHIQLEG
jgi:hypothetical protein